MAEEKQEEVKKAIKRQGKTFFEDNIEFHAAQIEQLKELNSNLENITALLASLGIALEDMVKQFTEKGIKMRSV